MGRISTALKRAWLSWCYENDTGSDLLLALQTQRNARLAQVNSGQLIAATAANNHSVSFSAPGSNGFSPLELVEFWQSMVDLFNDRKGLLTAPDNTDEDVFNEMLYVLQDVREVEPDYTGVSA